MPRKPSDSRLPLKSIGIGLAAHFRSTGDMKLRRPQVVKLQQHHRRTLGEHDLMKSTPMPPRPHQVHGQLLPPGPSLWSAQGIPEAYAPGPPPLLAEPQLRQHSSRTLQCVPSSAHLLSHLPLHTRQGPAGTLFLCPVEEGAIGQKKLSRSE